VKLSINIISHGRYFRAYEDDVPEDQVSAGLRSFAVDESEAEKLRQQRSDHDQVEARPRMPRRGAR
jgi:hypothetical protein